MQIILQRCTK